MLEERISLVYSEPIAAEYREVLLRSRFGFEVANVAAILDAIADGGVLLSPPPDIESVNFPDPSDLPFAAAARFAGCPLVAGNLKHFPASLGIKVISPAQVIAGLIR